MSNVEKAAEVLDKHRPVGPTEPQCRCGWREGFDPWAWRLHQAEALAAAGLLAEPTDQRETRTEWSLRWPSGSVGDPHPREEFVRRAQRDDYPDTTVLRREVGPWVEAPSP